MNVSTRLEIGPDAAPQNPADAWKRRQKPFNQGCDTEHAGEIELGHHMAIAADLLWGRDRCKRLISSSPSKLFRKFRYGRWFAGAAGDRGRESFILALHGGRFMGEHRAADEYIMTPGGGEWIEFLEEIRQVAHRPRYADGWTATAETLDDMGYAIAESIAVFELLGYEADEDLIYLLLKHD